MPGRVRLILTLGLALLAAPALGFAGLACAQTGIVAAFVVLGEDGVPVARVLTSAPDCPSIVVDGRARAMQLRAPAATVPQRTTASTAANSKPSAFPVATCEAFLPAHARLAKVEGRSLPLPKRRANRIVVIGDSGCRLKASDNAYQPCNDPKAYPFAAISRAAAAWKPDLVVHVGDLIYRENPCSAGNAGCAGSPWGYGLDAWRADLFDPGAPLLAAAPWVMTRGNHESCARAGQGWWRFMDPDSLASGQDCNDPARDRDGDYSPTFAVPIGGGAQIVVMDMSIVGGNPIAPGDPKAAQLRETYARLDELSRRAPFTFAIDHYPILGISGETADGKISLKPGNAAVQSVFGALNPLMIPETVDVLIAGHVHIWEQLDFSTPHPTQLVAGFSGTLEDTVPLPEALPAGFEPAPGAHPDHFSSWVDGFGYMTLERKSRDRWAVTIWDVEGRAVNHCMIRGRKSDCEVPRVIRPH